MDRFNNVSKLAENEFQKKLISFKNEGVQFNAKKEAALFAQCVQLQLLKAPATAIFQPLDEMTVTYNLGIFKVTGFVDSHNSYGAYVRTSFTFNIQKRDSKWVCLDKFVDTNTLITQTYNKELTKNTYIGWIIFGVLSFLSTLIGLIGFGTIMAISAL